MKKLARSARSKWVWIALAFCAGFALDAFIGFQITATHAAATPADPGLRERGKYKMIAPLLLCPTYDSTNVTESTKLKKTIETLIAQKKTAGGISLVSAYFRDFKGNWFGINENLEYHPASLLKVPLMIAYFRQAEDDPSILQKRLTYDGSSDLNSSEAFRFPDVVPGTYTVGKLIEAMVVNSDNNATALLYNNINVDVRASVFTDLGIDVPPLNAGTTDTISAKQYSYFFRVLYNSTYLTPEYSEKALELLGTPNFPQGVQASVPSGVVVADKFGERTVTTSSGAVVERDLHDCGIVYGPKHPYLLCIMTRGKDFTILEDVIQSISKVVYQAQ